MKTFTRFLWIGALLPMGLTVVHAEGKALGRGHAKLRIQHDGSSGRVVVSWDGAQGSDLAQSRSVNGQYERLRRTSSPVTLQASEDQMHFELLSGAESIFSINVVGYVNTQFPPGLSLKANPLVAETNTLAHLIPTAPDGTQVYKFTEGSNYEISTFDAVTMSWSNPEISLEVGTGFFFNNPSSTSFPVTFIGEVRVGWLTNNLPAGFSTEGSLVPQAGSINSVHRIPGEPGDVLRLYVNDGLGGGSYSITTFDGASNSWVPDLELGAAEGFWLHKQNAQDWVRYFTVFP
jgi:hypothetical protein